MRKLHAILLIAILIGVIIRFVQLDVPLLNGDEEFYIIAAEKFHVGSDYDVRTWNYHAPPVAKFIMSLPLVFTSVDYSIPRAMPPNLWVWNYVAYESIKSIYPLVRSVSAVMGALFVLLTYLIGKELFGKTAGLWAAASAAVSIDYIILSRVVLIDIFLYAFILSTAYFYIRYRKNGNVFLLPFLASLILMFGSKNAQWLVIIPPLLYTEIVANRENIKKTIHFLVVFGVAWFIHSSIIYPPEFSEPAQKFFTEGINKNVIEPHLDMVAKSFLTINSPFFLVVFALTILTYVSILRSPSAKEKIRRHLLSPSVYSFLIFFTITSMLAFTITSLTQNSKYIGQVSLPLFILGGYVVTRWWPRKYVRFALLGLLALAVVCVLLYFPTYEHYPGQEIISFSRPGPVVEARLDILAKEGNPPIITNEMNMLLFYPGTAVPIPIANSPECTQQLADALKAQGFVGVFKNIGPVERQYLCDKVFNYTREIPLDQNIFQAMKIVFYQ